MIAFLRHTFCLILVINAIVVGAGEADATPVAGASSQIHACAIPPGTTAVLRLRWASLLQAPLVQQVMELQSSQFDFLTQEVADTLGVQVSAVEEIWVFYQDQGRGAMVMTGQFSEEKLRETAENREDLTPLELAGSSLAYEYQSSNHRKSRLAAYVPEIGLIAGGPDAVRAITFPPAGATTLAADQLTGTATIQGVTLSLPSSWLKTSPQIAMLIKSMTFALNVSEKLDTTITLIPPDPKIGEPLKRLLESLRELELSQPGSLQSGVLQPSDKSAGNETTDTNAPMAESQVLHALLKEVTFALEPETGHVIIQLDLDTALFGGSPATAATDGKPVDDPH